MNLVWFRNDLRVSDNKILGKACEGEQVIALYCFDPKQYELSEYGFKKTEKYRAQFLIETVKELKENLKKLNIALFVYYEKPEIAISKLAKDYNIENIYLQKEWTRDENEVLKNVKENITTSVNVIEIFDQFLFHPEDIPYENYQQLPEVFTNFRKKCEKYSKVRPTLPIPNPLPERNLLDSTTKIPGLRDLGLSDFDKDARTAFPFKGGESRAIARINEYFWETKKLAYYKKTRNGLLGKDYSSKLSAWLANGSISPRTIYWEVKRFEKEIKKNQDTYWLIFELIWRDYFKYISLKHGDKIFHQGGILKKEYEWNNSSEALESWINGTINESFVNANMRELALTGWMSNRGRQNVASFWSKELKQDWRVGASYFESLLVDYDVHSNWGNWMYNSGVGNDPRDRKFNIKRQADMYDRNGAFQNQWLQETLF
ncbi:DASH family cryptochrome [Maribacter sp. 2210JD10-5]|uniref:DASH family cryptochrome n=1 Tax=Maribacter sp. 2210JD10-5 TaxID=3386272 RepID=UPI0039BCBFC1